MNLRLMLAETVQRFGSRTAIIRDNREMTYTELDIASNKIMNSLIDMGMKKGDRVTLLMSNSPEFITCYFGIIKLGAICVPLDVRYTATELVSLYDNSTPRILIAESQYLKPLIPALPMFKSIEKVIEVGAEPSGKFTTYADMMENGRIEPSLTEIRPQDTAHIAYTSGSTGRPKGVMLSHGALVSEAKMGTDGFQQAENDVLVLFALPLHHAFALEVLCISTVSQGSKIVIVPGISPGPVLDAFEKHKCTIFMGVPYTFSLLTGLAEREGIKKDVSSVRLYLSGGSILPNDLAIRFTRQFGKEIHQIYGMTESAAHSTMQPIKGPNKLGSAGRALGSWQIRIVDDNGKNVPVNEPGEVIMKGPIMTGYYGNPEATAQTIRDAWLYSGDIGKLDEDGNLFILSRKKDMMKVQGQNVFPIDIEDVIVTNPKVAEVAVVGVADEIRGEKVRAVIVPKAGQTVTEREIKEFCRQKLANFKIPKEVIILQALPRTATGKIRKEALKITNLESAKP